MKSAKQRQLPSKYNLSDELSKAEGDELLAAMRSDPDKDPRWDSVHDETDNWDWDSIPGGWAAAYPDGKDEAEMYQTAMSDPTDEWTEDTCLYVLQTGSFRQDTASCAMWDQPAWERLGRLRGYVSECSHDTDGRCRYVLCTLPPRELHLDRVWNQHGWERVGKLRGYVSASAVS
jgi:hypothetical protein